MLLLRPMLVVFVVAVGISTANWACAHEDGSPDSVKSDRTFGTQKDRKTTKALNWETGEGKSYLIPALEIPAC